MVGEAPSTLSVLLLGVLVLSTTGAALVNRWGKAPGGCRGAGGEYREGYEVSEALQLTTGGALRRRTTPLKLFGSTGSPLRVI